MRFLVDECLPPRLAELLQLAGHDAIHLYDLDAAGIADDRVMEVAADEARVLLSADTDFGELLARGKHNLPSIVLIRRRDKRAARLATVLLAQLGELENALTAGALVVIGERHVRIRALPLA